jgi:hypothetical protein
MIVLSTRAADSKARISTVLPMNLSTGNAARSSPGD